ncbi:MAG: hypothetical protein IJI53_11080 [Clostridia bacterium]|nr:hypothetical protein [Clostridia bacterium]
MKDFIRGLSAEKKAATIDAIDLLEEFGINLGMPHARFLMEYGNCGHGLQMA